MTDVKSKNLYELLGNDEEEDSDREVLPTKVADKPVPRAGKRDAPKAAPSAPVEPTGGSRGGRGGRRGDFSGSEGGMNQLLPNPSILSLTSLDHPPANSTDPLSFPRPQHW